MFTVGRLKSANPCARKLLSQSGSSSLRLFQTSPTSWHNQIRGHCCKATGSWLDSHQLPDFPVDCSTIGVVSDEDRQYLRQALAAAKTGLGKTYPNPAVGCVIVNNGQVVGVGYHPKAGMPHAEVYALRAAGNKARGSTAYVTLEPCNHYGRTPPCSQALVDAGVARVVVGVGDPNPMVASSGFKTLTNAGIEVCLMDGTERQECYDINAEFMERMQQEAAKSSASSS